MIYFYNKHKLDFEKVNLLPIAAQLFVLILVCTLTSFFLGYKKGEVIEVTEEGITSIIKPYEIPFSEEALYNYLKELNVKFPEIIIAQARLETANYTSTIFKENNNLFGMKEAKIRITTNKGSNLGHAVFDNWQDSVLDYAFYQARYLGSIKTQKEYFDYLNNRYAEDPNYISKVNKIVKDVESRYNS